MEGNVMVEKTCAACDCKLDANSIKVTIGSHTVEAMNGNKPAPIRRTVQTASGRISYMEKAPTLIVWGTDDVYFDVKWSRWLAETIPGTRRRVEIKGARLFFPEERWLRFNYELRTHWQAVEQEAARQQ